MLDLTNLKCEICIVKTIIFLSDLGKSIPLTSIKLLREILSNTDL